MIEWSDEAIAAALRVWLRLSEVGEFRDVRWRETMRQALEAAVEAQNRPGVMGDALAKALIRATDLEVGNYRLRAENEKLREALNWFLNGAVPLGGLTRYEYDFVVEARKRAAALKETE